MDNQNVNAHAVVPAVAAAQHPGGNEEDQGRFRQENDLARVLGRDDPNRMKLTATENRQALDIKELVESLPDLDNLNDFVYAQLALVCKNDLEDVVRRCYGLQEFKKEYRVLDTYEEGCRCFAEVFRLFPEQNLSFSFSVRDGTYVFLHDNTKFEPKAFTTAQMADDWLKAMYYWHTNFCPDLESTRKGIIVLAECEGMTMRRDVLKHISALFSQLLSYYPVNGQVRHLNTGAMWNVACSLLRPLLPLHLRDNFQVGFKFEDCGRAFLMPSVEEANRRLLGKMQGILRRRYDNEKSFTLS